MYTSRKYLYCSGEDKINVIGHWFRPLTRLIFYFVDCEVLLNFI